MMEGKLTPVHKLALESFGWALVTALAFFFHVVGFVAVIVTLALKLSEFKFVYENTKDFPYDTDEYYQPAIPGIDGTELWPERESDLRTHVPENNGRWI